MADDEPIADFDVYSLMDIVLDKLRALDYEREFCYQDPHNFKPFNKVYFAVQQGTSTGQWFHFTSLVAWLMSLNNHFFPAPDEFDNPTAVASNIAQELDKLGIKTPFSSSKLQPGFGLPVVYVLDALCDKTLEYKKVQFSAPQMPVEDYAEEAVVEEDMEVVGDDEIVDEAVTESDDDGLYIESAGIAPKKPERTMVETPKVDPDQWRLEVERVAPQLKVTMIEDQKDWRTHVEQMKKYQESINGKKVSARSGLSQLSDEIAKTLEKISTREKYLNTQFETHVKEYQRALSAYQEESADYKENSETVTTLQNELARVNDELEEIRETMQNKSGNMMDSSPIAKIKASMAQLKSELKMMELQIGVTEHALLQAKLREKNSKKEAAVEAKDWKD